MEKPDSVELSEKLFKNRNPNDDSSTFTKKENSKLMYFLYYRPLIIKEKSFFINVLIYSMDGTESEPLVIFPHNILNPPELHSKGPFTLSVACAIIQVLIGDREYSNLPGCSLEDCLNIRQSPPDVKNQFLWCFYNPKLSLKRENCFCFLRYGLLMPPFWQFKLNYLPIYDKIGVQKIKRHDSLPLDDPSIMRSQFALDRTTLRYFCEFPFGDFIIFLWKKRFTSVRNVLSLEFLTGISDLLPEFDMSEYDLIDKETDDKIVTGIMPVKKFIDPPSTTYIYFPQHPYSLPRHQLLIHGKAIRDYFDWKRLFGMSTKPCDDPELLGIYYYQRYGKGCRVRVFCAWNHPTGPWFCWAFYKDLILLDKYMFVCQMLSTIYQYVSPAANEKYDPKEEELIEQIGDIMMYEVSSTEGLSVLQSWDSASDNAKKQIEMCHSLKNNIHIQMPIHDISCPITLSKNLTPPSPDDARLVPFILIPTFDDPVFQSTKIQIPLSCGIADVTDETSK